jgi:hypothetical protein
MAGCGRSRTRTTGGRIPPGEARAARRLGLGTQNKNSEEPGITRHEVLLRRRREEPLRCRSSAILL